MRVEIRVRDRSEITVPEADRALCAAAWRQIAAGIEGGTAILAEIEPEWVEALTHGDDTRGIEARLARQLASVQWAWPWFEEWLRSFHRWGQWPHMWAGIDTALAGRSTSDFESQVARLIPHTAMTTFSTNRRVQQGRRLPRSWQWRLLAVGDPGGVAERRAAEPYSAAIRSGDLSAVPPYFPGDRTLLHILSPRQQERWPGRC